MSNTLLPCPFCGGAGTLWSVTQCESVYAVCQDCGTRTIDYKYAATAIAAWNSRTGKDINVATNNAMPVVRGEWVEAKSGVMSVWPPGQVMCSVCGQRMPSQWKKMPPYCYGCGAKMK